MIYLRGIFSSSLGEGLTPVSYALRTRPGVSLEGRGPQISSNSHHSR